MKAEWDSKLEEKAWNLFTQNASLYEPLEILSYETAKNSLYSKKYIPDAYLTLSWRKKKFKFPVEVTGKFYLEEKLAKLKQVTPNDDQILIIVPYISKGISELIKKEQICCLDLSGNYYIQTDDLLAIRLDQPDQNKAFSKIKKFYSGNSSLVGRLLLAGRKSVAELPPPSLEGLQIELRNRGGSLSLSAISKVLSEMARDQVILKTDKEIKLLQARKLLERLADQYKKPVITQTIKLNCLEDPIEWLNKYSIQWARTGVSSVERYAVSALDKVVSVYVNDTQKFMGVEFERPNFQQYQNDRFYNLVVNITSDSWVYFDYQDEGTDRWSSQVQSYLELSQMDKREKEIAETIKTAILAKYE